MDGICVRAVESHVNAGFPLGADAVLLGCTELGMLANHDAWPDDIAVLDSTPTHIEAIFNRSLRQPADSRVS